LAFWSEFASAFAAQVHSLCASVTAVYLPFFVFGRVLTRLDQTLSLVKWFFAHLLGRTEKYCELILLGSSLQQGFCELIIMRAGT